MKEIKQIEGYQPKGSPLVNPKIPKFETGIQFTKNRFLWIVVFVVLTISIATGFALTKLRSVAISNGTMDAVVIGGGTPAAATVTQLTVNSGISTTGGLKLLRVATCTTPAGLNQFCQTTVTFPGAAFVDTNYTLVCQLDGAAAISLQGTGNKTTTTFTFVIYNVNGNTLSQSGTIQCLAAHD